jgi:hypothetical protein
MIIPESLGRFTMSDKMVSFSTTLTAETKELLERYCRARGIRMNHFVETAILEKLEDEMDSEIIGKREFEELIAWKKKA